MHRILRFQKQRQKMNKYIILRIRISRPVALSRYPRESCSCSLIGSFFIITSFDWLRRKRRLLIGSKEKEILIHFFPFPKPLSKRQVKIEDFAT